MSAVTGPTSSGVNGPAQMDRRAALLEAIDRIERQLRLLRRSLETPRIPRDLGSEIEGVLTTSAPLTVPELGAAIRARHADVRRVLHEQPGRFQYAQNIAGRSPKAKCWMNAAVASRTRPDTSDDSLEVPGG